MAGNFNGWSRSTYQLSDNGCPGTFRRHAFVEPGRIEYKFPVNGECHIDANCPGWAPNNFGSLNSAIDVH